MINKTENILCSILNDSLSEQERLDITRMSSEDWTSIYKMARQNNLLPLLYYKLDFHKITLPIAFKTTLRTSYMVFEVRDMRRKRQLLELIKIFNDHGIDHILLKGSHLAEKIYHNPLFRYMCDIDVLIRKPDFYLAYDTLKKHGYASSVPDYHDTELLALNKHYPELVREGDLAVELHWNIHSQYDCKNIDNIWIRAENTVLGDQKTKILSPEDLLVHLCVHKGCDNNFISSLLLLNDIKEILLNSKIDMDKLYKIASSIDDWHNTKCLFSALYLCEKLLKVNIPEGFLEKIKPADFNEYYEELLLKQFFTYSNLDPSLNTAAIAIKKISSNPNPLMIFKYLMTPKRICVRYDKKYSLGVLPYLYCKRITRKLFESFRIITGLFNQGEKKKLYDISKVSGIVDKWLKN